MKLEQRELHRGAEAAQPLSQAVAQQHQQPAAIRLRVEVADLNAHLFGVTLEIARPEPEQIVALPVWIPGSYLVREFSKNLQSLSARQGARAVPLVQLDKHRWQAQARPREPLVLSWQVHAFDASVRSAWLDARRGFFNGTSLFLAVVGQQDAPHRLELAARGMPAGWQAATALAPIEIDAAGFGAYSAANYEELIDCPVELGRFWSAGFDVGGVAHRFVVAGAAPSFDGARLAEDAKRICGSQIRFWHRADEKPPHSRYLFLLNAVDDGYGGLEHRNSTALICKRSDLPRVAAACASAARNDSVEHGFERIAAALGRLDVDDKVGGGGALDGTLQAVRAATAGSDSAPRIDDGYRTLLGLISHEYFHTWNVKRLRPAEFARLDPARENYTELLWFFEGFTSYYDDLLLRRAGLIGDADYLKLLTKNINQVRQTPGRLVQSVAQASFDAWVKYYRPDENTPNATVSYYTKGALVALCFDLSLREQTAGGVSLDDAMRALWRRCAGGPMSEADLAAVLEELGGRSFAPELAAWVHGTGELPLAELLDAHGVAVHEEPSQLAQRLGLRVAEAAGAIVVKTVLRGGAAERAGIAPGDEWLGVEAADDEEVGRDGDGARAVGWRLRKLDDLPLYAGSAGSVVALVARDARLLRLPLALPPNETTWRLSLRDAARARPWLSGEEN